MFKKNAIRYALIFLFGLFIPFACNESDWILWSRVDDGVSPWIIEEACPSYSQCTGELRKSVEHWGSSSDVNRTFVGKTVGSVYVKVGARTEHYVYRCLPVAIDPRNITVDPRK
jgi:hypothetical protein